MEAAAALKLVKATQIPLTLLSILGLNKPLWPPERTVQNNSHFDYIVVGAGTAGCVLLNRLTEDPNTTVLGLEFGDNPSIESALPPLFVTIPMSRQDYNFTGTKDTYAAGSQDNVTKLTSGKVLGGSSGIGHFIYVRGNKHDFNSWAEKINDSSWNYENILPYFIKSENLKDSKILKSKYGKYHGTKGPMGLTREPRLEAKPILKSFNETGNPILLDVNGDDNIGFSYSMVAVADGVRQSSAYSYITPIKDRPNLYLMRNTRVIRIIFENKRAVAVVAIRNGTIYVYRACKEIILSAGVFNTPQLLMLSGIGDRDHLKSFDIKVKADLPVGNNLQDQVAVALVYKTAPSISPPPPETFSLTQVPFPVIIGLKALNNSQAYADYQVFVLPFSHDLPFLLLSCAVVFQYRPEICDQFNNESKLRNSVFSLLTITKPESRGFVRLSSANPCDKPEITTGYFHKEKDLDNMVKYIKNYIEVGNSTYFKKVGAELIKLELPKCRTYTYGTDEFWRCYVLNMAVSPYHVTSSCAMGSVVDSRLRVYNVTNLRVVDASVMPHLTSGSPYAAVMMIAEKASDMIKEDANKEASCHEICFVSAADDTKRDDSNKENNCSEINGVPVENDTKEEGSEKEVKCSVPVDEIAKTEDSHKEASCNVPVDEDKTKIRIKKAIVLIDAN